MTRPPMSDKPESSKRQPTFEEILSGAKVAEPASKPPPPKKSAQPTFEEILSKAQPSGSEGKPPAVERRPRPPRQKEERKMPIVVRKPALGQPLEPVTVPEVKLPAPGEVTVQKESDPGSVFAQPSPDESADF